MLLAGVERMNETGVVDREQQKYNESDNGKKKKIAIN